MIPSHALLRLRAVLTPTHRNITPPGAEPAERSVSYAKPGVWHMIALQTAWFGGRRGVKTGDDTGQWLSGDTKSTLPGA